MSTTRLRKHSIRLYDRCHSAFFYTHAPAHADVSSSIYKSTFVIPHSPIYITTAPTMSIHTATRSEERRVGKQC